IFSLDIANGVSHTRLTPLAYLTSKGTPVEATAFAPRITSGRAAYSILAALLLASILFEVVKHGTGYWQLAAFGLGPDLALLYGAAAGLEKGQLAPRAVPLYNLVHRFWLPLALIALAS